MIVGLIRCEHGEIFLDNRDISRLPMHRRAQLGLGYLPQEPLSVPPGCRWRDNIMAILETRPGLDDAGRTARLKELLGELHIGHVQGSLGVSLSGGERRRWRSPAPWRRTLGSSCWTNPLPASTPIRRRYSENNQTLVGQGHRRADNRS